MRHRGPLDSATRRLGLLVCACVFHPPPQLTKHPIDRSKQAAHQSRHEHRILNRVALPPVPRVRFNRTPAPAAVSASERLARFPSFLRCCVVVPQLHPISD